MFRFHFVGAICVYVCCMCNTFRRITIVYDAFAVIDVCFRLLISLCITLRNLITNTFNIVIERHARIRAIIRVIPINCNFIGSLFLSSVFFCSGDTVAVDASLSNFVHVTLRKYWTGIESVHCNFNKPHIQRSPAHLFIYEWLQKHKQKSP